MGGMVIRIPKKLDLRDWQRSLRPIIAVPSQVNARTEDSLRRHTIKLQQG